MGEYRLKEARDSKEEAEILLEKGKTRGALNRVYYAMFYAVLALLASRQLSASKHSGVISLFHREFVKTGVMSPEVAKFLDIAFDLRNKCDYRDFITPEAERVTELLKEAETFIATIETILIKL
ncbi:MAG: HEPN domain-containing protein [Nitrospirae bacterium]|nr:HEPN domain-containing protein [Nitrospirota bacterium]